MGQRGPGISVAHLIADLGRAQGGPVFNLSECCRAQAELGLQVSIFTTRRNEADGAGLGSQVTPVKDGARGWGAVRKSQMLREKARAAPFDVLHSHGLWTDANRIAGQIRRERKLPHVLTPCGMLAPGALRHHWWKKVPARIWFQARALREVSCFQAQSELEAGDIRRFGLGQPVALVPAAVPTKPSQPGPRPHEFRARYGIRAEHRVALYLGRIHPVKGLSRLLRAWAAAAENAGHWVLVLAGPDEGGFEARLRSEAARLGITSGLLFTGALGDSQKWGALGAADLFIMPSDFESFGLAVVEAMQSELPVITTRGTPWQTLPEKGAGWWVEPTVEAVRVALAEALALPESARREMGRRAAVLAERFRPERAAWELAQVYEWLMGRGPRPECVRMD